MTSLFATFRCIFLFAATTAACSCLAGAGTDATWQKPKTTRRYLHGPLSERLLVYWREGKVTFGEVAYEEDWRKTSYYDAKTTPQAHGVWLLHGDADEPFDFRAAELSVEPDATPIHGQVWRTGDLLVSLEGCAPFGRRPSAHMRLKVENAGTEAKSEKFALLLRTAEERQLVFGAPDVYEIYAPTLEPWLQLTNGWAAVEKGVWRDGDRFVAVRTSVPLAWDARLGAIRFRASVGPRQSLVVDFTSGKGMADAADYGMVRDRTRTDWQRELTPVRMRSDLIRHLTVQMLQCFSSPTGDGDDVLPRQGGLQRWVWPWDQSYAAAALTRLGYGNYVERACDFYFGHYATENGMIGPFGNGWINDTANVLTIFSRHCRETDRAEFWKRHRDAAVAAFRWIRAQRALTRNMPGQIPGLFPSGKSSDNHMVFQSWGTTDLLNLQGLERFTDAAEHFGDAIADEARTEAEDYRRTINGILDRWRHASCGKDTLFIPYRPDGKDEKLLRDTGYFYAHTAYFALLGFLNADELRRVRTYMLREGLATEEGLYFHHPSRTNPSLGEHVWYTTASEYNWFFAWMRCGRADLARQALESCLKYAVTDEFYVGERFHDATPWFLPWSPNASGAGRIVQMLLDER